jgi:hypothetical protein
VETRELTYQSEFIGGCEVQETGERAIKGKESWEIPKLGKRDIVGKKIGLPSSRKEQVNHSMEELRKKKLYAKRSK